MTKKPPAAFFIVGGDIIFLNPFFERIKARLKIRTLKPAIGARDYPMALIGIKAICQFSVFYTYGVLRLITVEVNFIGTLVFMSTTIVSLINLRPSSGAILPNGVNKPIRQSSTGRFS